MAHESEFPSFLEEFEQLKREHQGFFGRPPFPSVQPQPPKEATLPSKERKTIAELLPHAITLQQQLSNEGIVTFLGGGLATDVLAQESLPDHHPRLHKDIDLLIPRTALRSVGYLLEALGYHEVDRDPDLFADDANYANLRVFVKSDIEVDLMGYRTYHPDGKTIAELPLMSWGKIDQRRQPISLDLPPRTISTPYGSLSIATPESLLRMKSAESSFKGNDTQRRDLAVLQQLVAH